MNGNRHHVGDQPLNEQEYDNNEIVRDSESAAVDLSLLSTQMRYIFAAWQHPGGLDPAAHDTIHLDIMEAQRLGRDQLNQFRDALGTPGEVFQCALDHYLLVPACLLPRECVRALRPDQLMTAEDAYARVRAQYQFDEEWRPGRRAVRDDEIIDDP